MIDHNTDPRVAAGYISSGMRWYTGSVRWNLRAYDGRFLGDTFARSAREAVEKNASSCPVAYADR